MNKNTLNNQWNTINRFLYLGFALLVIMLSLIRISNVWINIIGGIIVTFIILRFGCKNLNISIKGFLFTKQKKDVTVLDGLLITLLLFTTVVLLKYIYFFFLFAVLKLPNYPNTLNFPTMLYSAIIAPVVEETIFRVVGLRVFEKAGGKTFSVLLTAFFFGFLHIGVQAPVVFISGIASASLVFLTGSVWYSFLYHILMNNHAPIFSFLFPDLGVIYLFLGLALILFLSLILLQRRPVFRQLLKWGSPKRVMKNIKSQKANYMQIASSPVLIIVIFSLGILTFMSIIAQLSQNTF